MFLTELDVSRALYYICGVSSLKARFPLVSHPNERSFSKHLSNKQVFCGICSLKTRFLLFSQSSKQITLITFRKSRFPLETYQTSGFPLRTPLISKFSLSTFLTRGVLLRTSPTNQFPLSTFLTYLFIYSLFTNVIYSLSKNNSTMTN